MERIKVAYTTNMGVWVRCSPAKQEKKISTGNMKRGEAVFVTPTGSNAPNIRFYRWKKFV